VKWVAKKYSEKNKQFYSKYNLCLLTDVHIWCAVLCSVGLQLLTNDKTLWVCDNCN